MEKLPAIFEGSEVRIEMRDGEPWFVAVDVCRALELAKPSKAIESLDADEKGAALTRTLGGEQSLLMISEPGLYRLTMRSRKPAAKRFIRWVIHEVLPALRKTGRYELPAQEPVSLPVYTPTSNRGWNRRKFARESWFRQQALDSWGVEIPSDAELLI